MNQRGQSTVELVLLMPLLLVLVFLIFEFGRVFGSWLIITNAAREGARYAVVNIPGSCYGPPTIAEGSCTSNGQNIDTNIMSRAQQTAQFLTLQGVYCTGSPAAPPSGSTSCVGIVRNIDATTGDHIVTVVVLYQVARLTPISGNVPFFGSFSYPSAGFQVVGTSIMRSEQ